MSSSSWITRSPTALPDALKVLQRLRSLGPYVICRTAMSSSSRARSNMPAIAEVVDGHVLIYIHKEEALEDVERRYPAEHYVLVDYKLRILDAVKQVWRARVTDCCSRARQYAHDAK